MNVPAVPAPINDPPGPARHRGTAEGFRPKIRDPVTSSSVSRRNFRPIPVTSGDCMSPLPSIRSREDEPVSGLVWRTWNRMAFARPAAESSISHPQRLVWLFGV